MATSKRDTLIVGLRNAYALEGQAISTLENVHSRLEHYPELKAGVAQHLEETRRQQQLVEQSLGRFGVALIQHVDQLPMETRRQGLSFRGDVE